MWKLCEFCGVEFQKKVNCSKKDWLTTRFCSKQCVWKSQKGKPAWNKGTHGLMPEAWNKGQKGQISEETRKKMSLAKIGKSPSNKGISPSEETKQKIRAKRALQTNFKFGEKHWNWKGGKTKLVLKLRCCKEYKNWRSKIFQKDNFTCQLCSNRGFKLNADHIKPLSLILHENEIDSFEKAIQCEELWDLNNGRTLCVDCHKQTETFAKNTKYQIA